ncbi:MAG: KpsF/GutQ family sugar-phosphate isomerase [Alphaproteobacteria bacterium]|nr:MAG: KpsF/GutQ family sugar-phosphate isomerase [Alphaproteobacteria bacterium]TAF15917.1 MAG: KpsF/GutQ family sugar-phosphate isomerase [Alphaproteobacteria bacterium]TAF39931.1 MAG: KpsF/GutQ family sugar-phosphate isomerase [Alphaproteobacteria bacterium]TAF76731.1 MAG: KpsF/GutQ family sugar-phosphate isomerase [Alphaproteobacteria bacterium]
MNHAHFTSPSVADPEHIIHHGRACLARAHEGIIAISAGLDEHFVRAVELIYHAKGKLITTGMGKSGHIARKIAATFASTGTPSHFVHPAEASHGDMGMISDQDVILMLSNSGETAELHEMIAYARRFKIPMIALVRRAKSMLVDVADVPIVLPAVPEASDVGAPTTSTTMMLVYADALAMAVLELRGFTKEDFGILHPGGKLGQGLKRAADLMHKQESLPFVRADDVMRDVLLVMTRGALGCAIVLHEDATLAGIITDGDLRRHMHGDILNQPAHVIMTATPLTIPPTMLAAEVVSLLNDKNITSVVVIDDMRPIGLVHIHDCLRAGVV